MGSRGAHESYLQHDSNKYLKFEDELEKADGVYLFNDDTRGTIIRAGMSENECKVRYEQHNKMTFLKDAPEKLRQLYFSYPHETVVNQVEGRKGKFSHLSHLVGIEMLREKKTDILALFDGNDNEISEFEKNLVGKVVVVNLTLWRIENTDILHIYLRLFMQFLLPQE